MENPVVHILVSCRNPELFRASSLVFDTIRVGFPTWEIFATGNNLDDNAAEDISRLCDLRGIQFLVDYRRFDHADWIRRLIEHEPRPFFIVDTDVMFWDNMEQFEFRGPLHGRYIPQFDCPFTKTITHDRLHTAVLYIDPKGLKASLEKANNSINLAHPFARDYNRVAPLHYPLNGRTYFHDTLGQAFHAVGGTRFGEEILNRYDHIGAGTYLDLLDEHIPGARARQEEYLKHPKKARGLWRQQQAWFESKAA